MRSGVIASRLAIRIGKECDGLPDQRFERVASRRDLAPSFHVVESRERRMIQSMAADAHTGCGQAPNLERRHHLVTWQRHGSKPGNRVRLVLPPLLRKVSDPLQDRWRNRFDEQIRVSIAEYLERVDEGNAVFHRRQFPVM